MATFEDVRLNFDPTAPAARFAADRTDHVAADGLKAALVTAMSLTPSQVPWPEGLAPVPKPLAPAPQETDDLSPFTGYDAVVMTWTSAEAAALAMLLSPGFPVSIWYEYRHGVDAYIPLVTGPKAPFNDAQPEMKRYYHSLGLYFPIQIGNARVLLFKSGLHLDYDGPAIPVRKLVVEIAAVVKPKVFVTTGTGGGIGADVSLGDVVIAAFTRFDCTTQFKDVAKFPWNALSLQTSPLPAGTLDAITPALTSVNASRLPAGSQTPKMWATAADGLATTDFFGFDDSTDYYKLQGLGRACDMGDAMVGYALQGIDGLRWYSVRNASDPQIPNPGNNIHAASRQAEEIYVKYGGITTAASVIATWAILTRAFAVA